jgi:rubrerythrin
LTIKKTTNFKRRNRPNGRRSNFSKNGFDNNKPKGGVSKVLERYLTMAHDAQSNGDRIKAEGLFQHAEHYQRIMNAMNIEKSINYDVSNENGNNAAHFDKDKKTEINGTLSRTERAIEAKSKRLENNKNNQLKSSQSEFSNNDDIVNDNATLDGVEALKAFTSFKEK